MNGYTVMGCLLVVLSLFNLVTGRIDMAACFMLFASIHFHLNTLVKRQDNLTEWLRASDGLVDINRKKIDELFKELDMEENGCR